VISLILDVHNIVTSMMSFTVSDDTNSTNVVPGSDHGDITNVKLDESGDFIGLEIKADGIVYFDSRVGIANCAGIVGDKERNTSFAELHSLDLAEFIFRFFGCDAVNCKSTFDVIDKAEVFARLVNRDDVSY
jgi:hypothetical protein